MTTPPKKTAAEKKGEYRRGTQKKTPKGPSARGAAARAANDKRGVPSVAKEPAAAKAFQAWLAAPEASPVKKQHGLEGGPF